MAHTGDPYAQGEIGFAYWHGVPPVEVDLVEAYTWLTLATFNSESSSGQLSVYEKASWRLGQVTEKMTSEQVQEAETRAQEWVPDPKQCERYKGTS